MKGKAWDQVWEKGYKNNRFLFITKKVEECRAFQEICFRDKAFECLIAGRYVSVT